MISKGGFGDSGSKKVRGTPDGLCAQMLKFDVL